MALCCQEKPIFGPAARPLIVEQSRLTFPRRGAPAVPRPDFLTASHCRPCSERWSRAGPGSCAGDHGNRLGRLPAPWVQRHRPAARDKGDRLS